MSEVVQADRLDHDFSFRKPCLAHVFLLFWLETLG